MQNNTLGYLQSQESYSKASKLVKQIDQGDNLLLNKTIADLKAIASGQHPPYVHIMSLMLIKDIFLTGREEAVRKIEQELLSFVAQTAQLRKEGNPDRGENYFINRQEYKRGDQRAKEVIRKMGVDYVTMCLESVKVWADWIEETPEGHKSQFSQQYEELLRDSVSFPKERTLYREQDKQKFEKVYKKMEFFNSESQFQDSILNEANYDTIISKELAQCNGILEALKVQLQPTENGTNWKRVRQLMDRSDIFFHEESVRMSQNLKRMPENEDLMRKLLGVQSQFGRLIEDYEFYKAGKLPYQQFYRSYGSGVSFSSPKKPTPAPAFGSSSFQPQVHDSVIIPPIQMKKRNLNATSEQYQARSPVKSVSIKAPVVVGLNVEEMESIRKEHHRKQEELKLEYERLVLMERQSAETRVAEMKKMIQMNSAELKEAYAQRMEEEKELYKARYQELLKDLTGKNQEIENQRAEIRALEQDLSQVAGSNIGQQELFRRTQDQLARAKRTNVQLQDALKAARQRRTSERTSQKQEKILADLRSQQSSRSQTNEIQAAYRKLEKRFDNLNQENDILKEQLEIQRKKSYKANDVELQLLKDENLRFKQNILHLEEEITRQKLRIDLLQVENLKLEQSMKIKASINQTLQKQNQWMTKTMQIPAPAPVKRLEQSLVKSRQLVNAPRKISVREYLDGTLEGDTYFQQLSREFRVRFKRSCLKRKELLFKESGIEVGVISQKRASDHISIAVFLTNYGIKDINDLTVKILNPSTNDITCEASRYELFQQGQQQKFYVQAKILSYPMGPFILTLSYEDTTLQLLLPITIVRLVSTEDRVGELKQPSRLNLRSDHKVVSTVQVLREYFPGVTFTQSAGGDITAKIKAEHHHTYTTFSFDFKKQGDTVELAYEFDRGREEIMRYYIRILASIFEK